MIVLENRPEVIPPATCLIYETHFIQSNSTPGLNCMEHVLFTLTAVDAQEMAE